MIKDSILITAVAVFGCALLGAVFLCCGKSVLPPEPPVVVVGADGAMVDPCMAGCANLAQLGCAEASGDGGVNACTAACQSAVSGELAPWTVQGAGQQFGPTCWLNAKTKSQAQQCPGLTIRGCQ